MDAMPSPNLLTAGTVATLLPQPCTLVIFGGSGDLSHRKLLPAIYNLALDGVLPTNFAVVGFAIDDLDDAKFRAFAKTGIEKFSRRPIVPEHWADYERSLFYVKGSFSDPQAFERLKQRLTEIEPAAGIPGNRVFYLSIPPSLIDMSVTQLQAAGLVRPVSEPIPFSRIIVEKPVGRDLASAREINDTLAKAFDESQIYRIDHYLGKETVQNVMVMRFGNAIFEPLWNQKYIDHVQITVAEEEGVGTRARYYEEAGALRDMVQNHMLQLLCTIAMEPPWANTADVVRDYKLAVLRCLRPMSRQGHRQVRGPRPIRSRLRAWGGRAGLSPRGRRQVGFDDGNLRRPEIVRGQLALGRRAVLPAHRQAAAQARQRDCRAVQGRAGSAVQHQSIGPGRAERAGLEDPAGRGPVACASAPSCRDRR